MRSGLKNLALIAATTLIAPAALAESHSVGDAEAGKKVFKKCKACHQIGEGAKNRTGPFLSEVMGRTAGTLEGYKYGKSMIAAGVAGLVWDEALVAAYIENPKKFLQEYLDDSSAKSKMSLKVKKEADRVNVSAYVGTFSTTPVVEGEAGEGDETEETTSTD